MSTSPSAALTPAAGPDPTPGPATAPGPAPAPGRHARPAGRLVTYGPTVAVTLVAAVIFSWQVGRPGLWRDEAATIVACRRSLGDLFQLTGNLDLVHLAYYLLARISWQVDDSVTAVRVISVVAMSLTAGMLVEIGRRLGSARIGLLAGLLLAVNPFASRYAQEARPFAVVALLAAVSTCLLLQLLHDRRRGVLIAYAVSVILLGLFNVLALMLVIGHAGYVRWAADAPDRRRWLIPAIAGLVVISPFVLATFTQRGQVSWIERPHPYDLRALLTLEFGSRIAPLVVAVVVLTALAVRRFQVPGPARAAVVLGLGWAVLPPVLLFVVSQVVPLWDVHYLLFTLPGLSLLLAGLAPGLNRPRAHRGLAAIAIAVPIVLAGALGAQAQVDYRKRVSGHDEDLIAISDYLGGRKAIGDAVLFVPSELRVMAEVAPTDFAGLDDVGVAKTPLEADNLVGTPIAAPALPAALEREDRVWLVEGLFPRPEVDGSLDGASLALLASEFTATTTKTVTDVRITLYTRNPPS